MFDLSWIADLDAETACQAIEAAQDELRERELHELALAARWAALHGPETLLARYHRGPRGRAGQERCGRVGGDGTPEVTEFACAELAVVMGTGPVSASQLMADALDLQHRHPAMWSALVAGQGRVWKARTVARRVHAAGLSRQDARTVDAAVTPYVDSLSWRSFQRLLDAEIIAVDPAAAEQRRRARELEQFVSAGQSDEHGLKTLVARAEAGDVIVFLAMVARIADILELEGDTSPAGCRRARAIGVLAQPAWALQLLQRWAATTAHPGYRPAGHPDNVPSSEPESNPGMGSDGDPGSESVSPPVGDPVRNADRDGDIASRDPAGQRPEGETSRADLDVDGDRDRDRGAPGPIMDTGTEPEPEPQPEPQPEPEPGACPSCGEDIPAWAAGHASWKAAGGAATPFPIDPDKLRPKAVLHLRVSAEALRSGAGVAVLENDGVGPITVAEATRLLGHCQVTIRPILDLRDQLPVDAYEIPSAMREAVRLSRPSSVFPWTTGGLRTDVDHTRPYVPVDRGGPPGQTAVDNLGPLDRFGHRVKTHARGWRHHQPHRGVYLWRTPHGYWVQVDQHGTHRLGRESGTPDTAGARARHLSIVERHPDTPA